MAPHEPGDRVRVVKAVSAYTGCRGTVVERPESPPGASPLGYHVAIDGENGVARPFLAEELAPLRPARVRPEARSRQGAQRREA